MNKIKIGFKLLISSILIFWLIYTDKLDFSLTTQLRHYPQLLLQTLLIFFLSKLCAAYRWKLLLELQIEKKLPFWPILQITWIGQYFNVVLPGGVAGDLLKVSYVNKLDRNFSNTYLILASFFDHFFGLVSFFILQWGATLLNYRYLVTHLPNIRIIFIANILIGLSLLITIGLIFLPSKIQQSITKATLSIPKLGNFLAKFLSNFWILGKDYTIFLQCLIITIFKSFLLILSFFYLIQPFLNTSISLSAFFSFVPYGLITSMLPISFLGFGVGHVAFQTLFSFFNITNGATLFNMLLLFKLGTNLLGGFFFLTYKHNPNTIS